MDKLAGPKLTGVQFIASGSSADVLGAGTRAGLILQEASKDAAFAMILDRDYRDDDSLQALNKKLHNRLYTLSCHEVENVLLAPSIILKVLRSNGVETFVDSEQVEQELHDIAKSLAPTFAIHMAAYRIHNHANMDGEKQAGKPTDEASLRVMMANRLERTSCSYSEPSVSKIISDARTEIDNSLENGQWKKLLPGKELLEVLRVKHIHNLKYDLFKEQIVSRMVEDGYEPEEITQLCSFLRD